MIKVYDAFRVEVKLDDWEKQIKSEAVREFIHKFERRTQLRQMSKSECISTMYDIWHESGASEEKDIQEEQNGRS